jgi:isopenicillin N synthase-like dioxygenase
MAVDPLPPCDKFEPVKPTKLVTDFVSLHTVDLATYDDGPEARQLLANAVHDAMTTQGFFYLVNHGLSEESISRQVDIGHHILKNTPGEEKEALRAPIVEEGSYHGFKPRGHWRTTGNVRDKVENYVSRDMTRRQQPQSMKPFQPEIQKFTDYTHKELLYKLLHLFGIALKLDDEYLLINLHSYERHDETWLRYMKYYDDYTEEEKKQTGGLWLIGHQDFTSLSILFSQVSSSTPFPDRQTILTPLMYHVADDLPPGPRLREHRLEVRQTLTRRRHR